jgi:hypothetical protein
MENLRVLESGPRNGSQIVPTEHGGALFLERSGHPCGYTARHWAGAGPRGCDGSPACPPRAALLRQDPSGLVAYLLVG